MERHILPVVLCVATIYQLVSVTSGDVDAGMRVTVTEKTLQEINRVEIAEIESKLRGEHFPDQSGGGDLEWSISNLHVSHLDSLTANLDLQSGNKITWSGNVGAVTVKADYRVKYKTGGWISITIRTSGSMTAKVRGVSIYITLALSVTNGKLAIDLDKCTSNIDDLDLSFSGSLLAWILNQLVRFVEDPLKNELEKAFCVAVDHALSELSEDMTTVKTLVDIKMIGLPLVLDTSFAGITVTHDNICVYNKAEFLWNGRLYSPVDSGSEFLPKSDLGIGFDLKTDAVNNLVSALATAGKLDGELAYQELKDRNLTFFNLQCKYICIGNAFKQVSDQHPNSVLGMHWFISYGGLEVKKDELVGRLVGRVIFKAENETNAVFLFAASMNLTAHFQARFADNTLSVRAVGLGGQIVIDESVIGRVLSSNVLFILKKFILKVLRDELLQIINDYETDYPISLPARTSFKDAAIKLYPGVIRVEADVCYKTTYEFSGTGKWVGNYTTDSFDVQDTIPTTTTTTSTTTTTPTTTTTATTTTTPTTTEKQPGSGRQTAGQDRTNISLQLLLCMITLVNLLLKM